MKAETKAFLFSLALGLLSWLVSGLLRVLLEPATVSSDHSPLLLAMAYNVPGRLFVLALFLVSGLVIARVLHGRRLAQDELRASRERYRYLFDHAPEGMWELERDGTVLAANEALLDLLGQALEEVLGRHCHTVLHGGRCESAQCPVARAAGGEFPEEVEIAISRPDGRQALCTVHSRQVVEGEGTPPRIVQSFRNITEQRRAEARFQALVETTGDAVTIVSPDGRLTYANDAFGGMLKYPPEELVGRVATTLCDEANQAILKAQLQRRLTGAEDRYELTYTARDGAPVHVLISATPLFDEQGTFAGSFAVMKDVTELKAAAARTAHLNSVLQAIRNVNQLITRETDREKLLQGACDCLVETRGYAMAVLALAGEAGAFTATYGAAPGWPGYAMDPSAGQQAWRLLAAQEGPPVPLVVGEQQCAWSERLAREWQAGRTCMITRLEWGGTRYGFLGISLPAHLASSPDEQSLFTEVADDIAFALHALDTADERQEALANLEMTQFAVDRALDGVFWIDRQGRILWVNQAGCERLGYTVDEMKQMLVTDLDPNIPPGSWDVHWDAMCSDRGMVVESAHRAKDGRLIPMEITINHFRFGDEDYHFTFARDITERKQAEQELRRLNRQYELLVESQLVETFIIQRDRLVFANRTMHDKLGYRPGELVGKEMVELLPPEAHGVLADWRGDGGADLETQVVTKSGTRRWVQVWSQPIGDFEGTPAIIGHMVDVTEARELRGQLEHSQRLESLGTLAGGVAHEFNNVLQAILLGASLVQMHPHLGEAEAERIKSIIERTEYGARLTDQLLTFSRRAPAQYRPLNLNDVTLDARTLLERTMPRQVRIECHLEKALWTVNADAGRLKQVLINLVLNARDALPAGGQVTIETANVMLERSQLAAGQSPRPGPHVMLKVSDTGVGMDPQTMGRAFEPFFTTKCAGQGTGLGLAIVHGIIESHGGAIRVHSAPGRGTAFQIMIPASPEMAPEALTPTANVSLRGGSETILIVDDEREVLNGAEQILRSYGYHVLTAASGRAALEACRQREQAIDLVLLDLVMPGMSGQETLSRLRQMVPEVPVIIASGYISPADRERHGRHVAAHLEKPFTPQRLLEALREVLDRP